ncbi:DUF1450 domain-containing protein [Rossellomorea sp. NS-SX7]|uniref:DUF1450 domain-containing protein n=1 Tax=Rossellomorea sp. NS-SX7 TaxID=3463856 RepID=UPI004059199E
MNLINQLFSKRKKATIEFCEKNLDRFLTEENMSEYNQFLSQKNITYKEYECQSRCKECKLSPYALVNGEFTPAENSKELLEKMKKHVDQK